MFDNISVPLLLRLKLTLKVQSCKLYHNKYVIASKQITNIEIFASLPVAVFKLPSRKILLTNKKKTIETVKK